MKRTRRRRRLLVLLLSMPAILTAIVMLASCFWLFIWQLPPTMSQLPRAQLSRGSAVFCWEAHASWALTARPKWTMGVMMSSNGQVVSFKAFRLKPPSIDRGFWPLVVASGHIQVPLAPAVVLLALPPGIIAWWLRRRRPWQCQRCGYDRRATPKTDVCPECGAPP